MKIFITRKIPDKGVDLLRKKYEIEINPYDRILSKKEIINNLFDKDGLICLLTDQIDEEVISSEPKLKMIANYAVGYDNIDVAAATKLAIPVSNTPDVLTDATAEMAWALLFSVARRIIEGDSFSRQGKFRGWDPMLLHGIQISDSTLGIIGAGRIGTAFALKSKGFNMKILYSDERRNPIIEKELNGQKTTIKELLKNSDFISLHLPLIQSTYHLISEREFKIMKKNSILINTSRGPVIDEKALIKALTNKWIFGAGLDVYEMEPIIPKELKNLNNVVLQPHSSSSTSETRIKMAIMVAKNMIAGLAGKIPPNCVNPEIFKTDNKD
jgi:glyoxylate reductase